MAKDPVKLPSDRSWESDAANFTAHLSRWGLVPDGEAIATHSSDLLPVRRNGEPAMLKVARADEERRGGALMAWWDGVGASRVLQRDEEALLLERAMGSGSLARMAADGRDDEAMRIVSGVAAVLHAPRGEPPATLVPLTPWFASLESAAARDGGLFRTALGEARHLLEDPLDEVVLHGDLHHGNVLDFGDRGWLAIDPKGLRGERGFDFANLFFNPDEAIAAERFERRLDVVSEAAGLDRTRLLRWVIAWSGLSAAWTVEDGLEPDFTISEKAVAALSRG